MINLLPPNDKKQIRAGLSNTLLIRYCIVSMLLAVPLFLLLGGVYLVMINSKNLAEETIEDSLAKSSEYAEVKSQAQEFNSNLSIAKSILDKEVKYSKIAVAIAQAIPAGMSLENLTLDAQSFGQPMSINARGNTYDDAVTFKNILEQSTTFQDVRLQSVSKREEGDGVNIVISAVINPEVARL